MQKNILIGYFILLHIFLVIMLVKTDFIARVGYRLGLIKKIVPEITEYYEKTKNFLEQIDTNTPDGAVIFIGDSGIQGLCVSAVASPSVNFGIGTDTTIGVLNRVPKYQSLKRASACVISIGGNDIRRRENEEILKNYSAILQAIPPQLPIIVSAILPVNENVHVRDDLLGRNRRSRELNSSLKTLCATQRPNCIFVDPSSKLIDSSGNLIKKYHEGDGVHLNGAGNSIWIKELKEAVRKISADTVKQSLATEPS